MSLLLQLLQQDHSLLGAIGSSAAPSGGDEEAITEPVFVFFRVLGEDEDRLVMEGFHSHLWDPRYQRYQVFEEKVDVAVGSKTPVLRCNYRNSTGTIAMPTGTYDFRVWKFAHEACPAIDEWDILGSAVVSSGGISFVELTPDYSTLVDKSWYLVAVTGNDLLNLPWAIFVNRNNDACDPLPFMPSITSTKDIDDSAVVAGYGFWIASVPTIVEPWYEPLPDRATPALGEVVSWTGLYRENLVPCAINTLRHLSKSRNGTFVNFCREGYQFSEVFTQVPLLPLRDGIFPHGTVHFLTDGFVDRHGDFYGVDLGKRIVRINHRWGVQTVLGERQREYAATYWEEATPDDFEVVGDWSAVRSGFRRINHSWGVHHDERTTEIDPMATEIQGQHPHPSVVRTFVTDNWDQLDYSNDRCLMTEQAGNNFASTKVVKEFGVGVFKYPWTCRCHEGILYVTERAGGPNGAGAISMWDIDDRDEDNNPTFIDYLIYGEAGYAEILDSARIHLLTDLATVRAEGVCVSPEGLWVDGGYLYWASGAMAQLHRIDLTTHVSSLVWNLDTVNPAAIFHASVCVSENKAFVTTYHTSQRGRAEARYVDTGAYVDLLGSPNYGRLRGAEPTHDLGNYNTMYCAGGPRDLTGALQPATTMYGATSNWGLARWTAKLSEEDELDPTKVDNGQAIWSGGYDVAYGKYFTNPFGKLPWGINSDLDYTMAAYGFKNYPAWRQGLTLREVATIPITSLADHNGTASIGFLEYGTMIWSHWKGYAVRCTGHNNGGSNAAFEFDLLADTPAWSTLFAGSDEADWLENVGYYADGRPTGHHGYYIGSYNHKKGRIFMVGMRSAYGLVDGSTVSQQVDALRLVADTNAAEYPANDYDPEGEWTTGPTFTASGPITQPQATDPRTGIIYHPHDYFPGDHSLVYYDPETDSWTAQNPIDTDTSQWYNGAASVIDTKRNAMALLWNTGEAGVGGTEIIRRIWLDGSGHEDVTIVGSYESGDNRNGAALTFDEVGNKYYVGTSLGNVYRIDPVTGVMTFLFAWPEAPSTAMWNKMAYLTRYRGLGFVPGRSSSSFYFYPVRS